MDYATVIDQAVKQFYAEGNNDVHAWLLRVQASPEAWTFVWELLDPSKVYGIFFFPYKYKYLVKNNNCDFYHSQEKLNFMQLLHCMPKFLSNGKKYPRVSILLYRNV